MLIETNSESIKAGSLIFDNVFLGYEVKIGYLSLINTKTYVGHETSIEDYCVVGPNCTICGNVKIKSLLILESAESNLYFFKESLFVSFIRFFVLTHFFC